MATVRNIDRFRSDLKILHEDADKLKSALLVHAYGSAEVAKTYKAKGLSMEAFKELPLFTTAYQTRYS